MLTNNKVMILNASLNVSNAYYIVFFLLVGVGGSEGSWFVNVFSTLSST